MKIYLSIITITFLALQLIRPEMINQKVDENLTISAPNKVVNILKRSCYDCHSNQTTWPLYSNIAPISWIVAQHVNVGREVLNYSDWNSYDKDKKIKKLQRTIQTLNSKIMPLPSYLWIHKNAKLDQKNKEILQNWAKEELEKLEAPTF